MEYIAKISHFIVFEIVSLGEHLAEQRALSLSGFRVYQIHQTHRLDELWKSITTRLQMFY